MTKRFLIVYALENNVLKFQTHRPETKGTRVNEIKIGKFKECVAQQIGLKIFKS